MASTLDIGAMDFAFENSFHDSMEGFYAPAEAAKPSAPELLIFNHALAERLGVEVGSATDNQLARIFSGEERSEEHTSELQSLMRISYPVFCLHIHTVNKPITTT